MIRNFIGSILALVGATAAVWSPFRDWYDGRHGRDYRVQDLFTGITGTDGPLLTSVLLPLAVGALITLVGVVLRSRLLVAVSGLVVLGFTVLWMVRQGQAAGSLAVGGDGAGLGIGVALAAGGGLLLLVAAVVMSGRPRRGAYEETHAPPEEDRGPYGSDAGVPYRDSPHRHGPYDDGHGAGGPPTYPPQPGQRDER
ncbi:hypothetical protein ACLB9X_14970 [Streptomyces sp. 5K101]|uniref:hypothetical protein n=1 Tax=Streptomyces sp. 5K101 TaxID=3390037 RepID=UPI003974F272